MNVKIGDSRIKLYDKFLYFNGLQSKILKQTKLNLLFIMNITHIMPIAYQYYINKIDPINSFRFFHLWGPMRSVLFTMYNQFQLLL